MTKHTFTPIISHLRQDPDWQIQTNEAHCTGTADLAQRFAATFRMGAWGRLLGLMHDRGKESPGFQAYIRRSSGYDEDAYSPLPKHHSIHGAILLHSHRMDALHWLSNPVAGHHRGLYDTDDLDKKLAEEEIPAEISHTLPDVKLELPEGNLKPSDIHHLCRMLFSCLVDADRLDTERFMNPDKSSLREIGASMETLRERLDRHMTRFQNLPKTSLNLLRNRIQELCKKGAKGPSGFYELTVPTGGGKTLASVIWGINHAIHTGKRRVVIAIPFTSIIVQTAATLRDIFGEENVFEHHSAVDDDHSDDKAKLTSENWDAPIVVTTNVQLFESIFSNRPSACRKLHALTESVVILDEAQSLPLSFLQPIVDAMQSYHRLFGTSFLLCTASQPVLDGDRKGASGAIFHGIAPTSISPLIPEELALHDRLRRVELKFEKDVWDYDDTARHLEEHERVLCVVNTRRHALEIFNALDKTEVPTYHLSRFMCPAHLMETIDEIKERLKNPGLPIRVVSTQLIEAGVDMDFPVVYRELAGLDSLLQAAGRCNREGRLDMGATYVFQLDTPLRGGAMAFARDTMKDLLEVSPDADWLDPAMMRTYYTKLYRRTSTFDKEDVTTLLNDPRNCQYETASEKFKLIDEVGMKIIVNFAGASALVEQLKHSGPTRDLARKLGRYTVDVPPRLYHDLFKAGLIEEPYPGFHYIPLAGQYDSSTGLRTSNEYLEQNYVI